MKDKINSVLDKFYEKKILSITVTIVVLYFAMLLLCGKVSDNIQATAIKRIIFGIVVMGFFYWIRKGRIYKSGFTKHIGKGFVLLLPTLIIAILGMVSKFLPTGDEVAIQIFNKDAFIVAVLVGFAAALTEEFMTRGLPLGSILSKTKSRKEVLLLLLFSSFLFGFLHIGHVFFDGASISETIIQIAQATCIGLLYGAIFLRTGSIIHCMIGHGIWDFCTSYAPAELSNIDLGNVEGATKAGGAGFICIIMLLLALFMLRKSKWNEIKENFGIVESSAEARK